MLLLLLLLRQPCYEVLACSLVAISVHSFVKDPTMDRFAAQSDPVVESEGDSAPR